METKKPNNPSAFPQNPVEQLLDNDFNIIDDGKGMSLRDYFAGKALTSYMITCKAIQVNDGYIAETEIENLAKYSYQIADAMLKERLK